MLNIWAHIQETAGGGSPTPHERVTGGDFLTPADWTKVDIEPVDGNFVVSGGQALFSSRREYRIEQVSDIPPGASCDVSFTWDPSDFGLSVYLYLNGEVILILGSEESGPKFFQDTFIAGSVNNKIGLQARHVFPLRTCAFTNFSIMA